ncbi:eosinophil peroxidase [Acipenser ruthenus]|uniref:eosinophil peroxidase n=1 Tax=Acipenser ruthenus TaxID=7906 RepID=UPI002742176A|nr:eosinophil peroxidase [Acipenser ruthenus]
MEDEHGNGLISPSLSAVSSAPCQIMGFWEYLGAPQPYKEGAGSTAGKHTESRDRGQRQDHPPGDPQHRDRGQRQDHPPGDTQHQDRGQRQDHPPGDTQHQDRGQRQDRPPGDTQHRDRGQRHDRPPRDRQTDRQFTGLMVPLRVLLAMLALTPPPTPLVHCATHTEAAPKSGTVFVSEALRRAEERVNTAYTRSRERTKAALDEGSLSPSDLLTLFKQPAPETRSAVRAAELLDNTVEIIRQMVYTQEMELKNITELLTPQDLQALAEATGCSTQTRPPHCGLSCLDSKYRSITGACNNRKFPLWGASNTPYARWLPAEYDDGFSLPRGWNSEKLHHGFTLPPVRRVSHEVLYTRNENISLDESYSHMLVEWGQWIDHDLDLTPQSASTAAFHSGVDCSRSCTQRSPCFPIQIPEDDPRSCGEVECMPFFRSAPACVGGGEGQLGLVGLLSGRLGPREQLNSISSFVDASVVYGSSAPLAMALRNQSSQRGLLAVNQHASDQGLAYLPYLQSGHQDPCSRPRNDSADEPASNTTSCFKAGDSRANEHLGMQALHTLFLREHNRLALELGKLNPHWSGETIYQETRKLLGAVHQVLTWRDYLPRILGPDSSPRLLPPYAGYRPLADPRIANVFATAAFRFAHVTIQPQLFRLDQNYSQSPAHPSIQLHQSFFSSWRLVHEGGVDPLIRGLVLNPAKLQTQTQMMPEELTERLFQAQGALSLDLASLNLQRGRDHGLPGYNAWRRLCGLSAPRDVSELGSVLSSPSLAEKLSALYGTPENIDVWIGAISEPLLGGARVGALLACLLGRQFKALRDGDRFWWEREGVFSAAQRSELRRVSLSRIICDNTRIQRLPRDVFNRNQYPQDFVSCDSAAIPRLHLSAWREETDDPQCGALPRVDHSFSVRCRHSVFFECHPGYRLEGPASMTCDPERGEWSQPTPICQDTGSGPPRVTYIITAVIVVIGSAALISLLVTCHRRFSEKRRRPLIGGQCKGGCPGPEGGPDSTGGLH